MKKATKFFIVALLAGMSSFGYAQDYLDLPKRNEKVLGTISIQQTIQKGFEEYGYKSTGSKDDWYNELLKQAKQKYAGKNVRIRELKVGTYSGSGFNGYEYEDCYYGPAVGTVVYIIDPEKESRNKLLPAINKAMLNVPEGSRTAIDQVTVTSRMNSEELKDQLIDVLLDKGYRVVAKEHLEKLYREQQDQQSGIYNESTTVQESNFSAVGYFINVKVTETSIRVQVVNVSTGEYEGNATVNF